MSSAPRRTCIGCRRVAPPGELVRIARRPDGTLRVSRTEPGRGAWLCAATAARCFDSARRRRVFGRALRTEVADDELAAVRERLLT